MATAKSKREVAKRLITVKEAAAIMGIHESTYHRFSDQYPFTKIRLPGVKTPKIDRNEVDAYIESLKQ